MSHRIVSRLDLNLNHRIQIQKKRRGHACDAPRLCEIFSASVALGFPAARLHNSCKADPNLDLPSLIQGLTAPSRFQPCVRTKHPGNWAANDGSSLLGTTKADWGMV